MARRKKPVTKQGDATKSTYGPGGANVNDLLPPPERKEGVKESEQHSELPEGDGTGGWGGQTTTAKQRRQRGTGWGSN